MNTRKILIRISCYISILLLLFWGLKTTGLKVSDLSADTIRALAHDNLLAILLIMLLIMTLQNLFTFIPLVLVITINITLLGFWLGYIYSCLCSVIGSTLIFLSIRYVFPNVFSNSKFQAYNQKIQENGFKFVLFGRIFPFLPTNLINFVAGLSSIKVKHFLLATALGNMIYGLILSTASFGVIALFGKHPVLTIITLLIVIVGYFGFMYMRNKRRTEAI